MSVLHICNTFFESELECEEPRPLALWLRSHPAYAQLQFLPLLYGAPTDRVFVSDLPEAADPRLTLQPLSLPIASWAPSLAIATWAKEHSLPYAIPDWSLVKEVNSKVFSFLSSPRLPGAELLATPQEVEKWIAATPGPKVLKTAFGTAGRGHFHVGAPHLDSFLQRQFRRHLPVIGEPWVKRLLDFSTQWHLGATLNYLGATRFENTPRGTYLATHIDRSLAPYEWALPEHLAIARSLLETLRKRGYFGHVGIDAFVYESASGPRLHPVVEINGRKTMSWVALQFGHSLSYVPASSGLLPSSLLNRKFSRNLIQDVCLATSPSQCEG